jgi:RimJ/RimL family protein N-acetyltransferase
MIASVDVDGRACVIRSRSETDACPDVSSEWDEWDDGETVPGEHHRAVIVVDDHIIGTLSWHAVHYGPTVGSRAWSMGIALAPQWRGQGWGSLAQRLLADHLLASAHRVEASTDVDNVAEQRSLEKAGFHREGILRGAQMRADGRHHDLVMYARTRD